MFQIWPQPASFCPTTAKKTCLEAKSATEPLESRDQNCLCVYVCLYGGSDEALGLACGQSAARSRCLCCHRPQQMTCNHVCEWVHVRAGMQVYVLGSQTTCNVCNLAAMHARRDTHYIQTQFLLIWVEVIAKLYTIQGDVNITTGPNRTWMQLSRF